jgi:hypothetical protein
MAGCVFVVGLGGQVLVFCGLVIAGCVYYSGKRERSWLVCGLDFAGCVVVEWEKGQLLIYLRFAYFLLCSGRVVRGTGVG